MEEVIFFLFLENIKVQTDLIPFDVCADGPVPNNVALVLSVFCYVLEDGYGICD